MGCTGFPPIDNLTGKRLSAFRSVLKASCRLPSSSPPPSPPKTPLEACDRINIATLRWGVFLCYISPTPEHPSTLHRPNSPAQPARQRSAASAVSIYSIIESGRSSITLPCPRLSLVSKPTLAGRGQMASALRRGTTAHKMRMAVPRFLGASARHLGGQWRGHVEILVDGSCHPRSPLQRAMRPKDEVEEHKRECDEL